MSSELEDKYQSTPLFGGNSPVVEGLYEDYLDDPGSVPPHWAAYFEQVAGGEQVSRRRVETEMLRRTTADGPRAMPAAADTRQGLVSRLIQVYLARGHMIAKLDPLGLDERAVPSVLKLDYFGLSDADLDTEFQPEGLVTLQGPVSLRRILEHLNKVYCDTVGVEFAHVSRARERLWLHHEYETAASTIELGVEEKKHALYQLTAAEGMERYLHTRFVGQKRFSLEGGESMIVLLDDLVQHGGTTGVREFVIGMAHRGRINVLVNLLGKAPADLFSEFEGDYDLDQLKGSGDVKYHKGFSSDVRTPGGDVHLALAFNPSHLEIVNPVVVGSVRARQQRFGEDSEKLIVPVLIHGDSAFAGQGVVMETLQMSQARGFATGGAVHVICNNQIGFTTSDPRDTRSTPYASDVAKMIEAPIFHVNGDDPEAVIRVTRLALKYRQQFGKDVVIDLVCYRRLGHNEADEPAVTQPRMYRAIREHLTTRALYSDKLVADGVIEKQTAPEMAESYREALHQGKPLPKALIGATGNEFTVDWSPHVGHDDITDADTAVDTEKLQDYARKLLTLPDGLKPHPRVRKIMDSRAAMAKGEQALDWGFAETLAYASLLCDGYEVRLTGQDSGRGTFFHRHAALHEQTENHIYIPLRHLSDTQARFTVTDSLLSEEAVLGFEYGFASCEPDALVIWEGQFGDFVNGAQVVIDQFISSGEAKWGRLCGLTLFLPHGYEGQGPEHSSARLERFLQLCAEQNMQVCVPSTPAQMFHMLRRQMLRPQRKPLIVMTPKSLLRHKLSVSSLDDLSSGRFTNVIADKETGSPKKVTRVVACSGKVYFDLFEARAEQNIDDVALIRIEQLYPFPVNEYAAALGAWPNAREIVWCQEEPQNQGAWYQIAHRLVEPLTEEQQLSYAGRDASAAPASGIYALHERQQKKLISDALGRDKTAKNSQSGRKSA